MDPLLLFLVVLLLIFGGSTLALKRETRRAGGLKLWLADLPTTNFRIFVSILLAIFYVVITLLLTVMNATNPEDVRPLPDVVLDTIGLFLIGMMGIDAASYIAKRLTHRGNADSGPQGATGTHPVGTTVQTTGPTTVTVPQPPQPVEIVTDPNAPDR